MRAGLFFVAAGFTSLPGCVPHLVSSGEQTAGGDWVAPENGWPIAEPPPTLSGQGFAPGETPPDLRLVDQHGDEVSTWQFYGDVVALDVSTMWCAPCREIAEEAQATQEEFAGDGFRYVTVLQQDVEGAPPNQEDLRSWADYYGIVDAPVLGDGDLETNGAVLQGQFPAVLILGRDHSVRQRVNPPNDEQIRRAIEAAL